MAGCFLFVVAMILEFLIISGLFWVVCWALGLLGITLTWSWLASLGVFVLVQIIRIIF